MNLLTSSLSTSFSVPSSPFWAHGGMETDVTISDETDSLLFFLMKLLSCLSHSFRSPIVGFYQQWAFVVLHNLDSDATYPNVICRSILCHNYFVFNVRRYSFCSGVIL